MKEKTDQRRCNDETCTRKCEECNQIEEDCKEEKMGAYETECDLLQEQLNNGEISIKEYNERLRDIEKEL